MYIPLYIGQSPKGICKSLPPGEVRGWVSKPRGAVRYITPRGEEVGKSSPRGSLVTPQG